MHFTATGGVIQHGGTITAQNADGSGGEVKLQTGAGGTTQVNGSIDASGKNPGTTGGYVELTGDTVALYDNGSINVSGPAGGGTALLGGDAHGANATVYNAQYAYIGPNATVNADATDSGNGGKVVLWSNHDTIFYGGISAKGGPNGGNGGWVETSGHNLAAAGTVTTLAPKGQVGSWLLDPADLSISDAGPDPTIPSAYATVDGSDNVLSFQNADTTTNWTLTNGTLAANLEFNDITIQTQGDIDWTRELRPLHSRRQPRPDPDRPQRRLGQPREHLPR